MSDADAATKLRIRIGEVEVDYEGAGDFLRSELPALLTAVLELHAKAQVSTTEEHGDTGQSTKPARSAGKTPVSTSTVAAKIGCKSGSDLALAAAAALVIGEGKDSFSRSDLLKAMQSAKAYYKKSYGSNLSNYLGTLVKSADLLDHGAENYGLQEKKRKELETKVG
jgi:hypothetical protein